MIFIYLGVGAIFIALIVALFLFSYIKAPPDMAFIISGLKKEARIIIGRAAFKIPFFERVDKLSLSAMQVDVKTSTPIPTADYISVRVDSVANIKIPSMDTNIEITSNNGTKYNGEIIMRKAMQNFLNMKNEDIIALVKDVLEGNIREIVGQMKLEEMVSNRKKFAELVLANAAPDLAEIGLIIVSFNVQNFVDTSGAIENLGIDNIETIRKNAAIAKANATKEIEVAESAAVREANTAKVASLRSIAEENTALKIKKADLKRQADTEIAIAFAAKDIETEKQRKTIEIQKAEADAAKEEKNVEVQKQRALVKEQELNATTRKEADADLYKRQKAAEAEKFEMEKEAEANLIAAKRKAEAEKIKAEATCFAAQQEAAGIKAKGLAEAESIKAKGLAKAAGLDAEAEAMKKMQEAAIINMIMERMPEIASAIAAPLANIDSITMFGEGNVANLVKEVTTSVNQVNNGLLSGLGIDLPQLLNSVITGKAIGSGITANSKEKSIDELNLD